jgi:hypothetical protein
MENQNQESCLLKMIVAIAVLHSTIENVLCVDLDLICHNSIAAGGPVMWSWEVIVQANKQGMMLS